MKPRYKRRIAWSVVCFFTTLFLAMIIVPQFINLNNLKPRIENVINEQTGYNATIAGNVNFSLLGGATIVAHDIVSPKGKIEHVLFSVPLHRIFNLESAPLTNDITVYGADLTVNGLVPPKFNNVLNIKNSTITFKDKKYEIINANLNGGLLMGTVRTNQHKYEFDTNGDEFHIKNKTNNLDINGHLFSDGTAHGKLSIDTDNVNEFFDFAIPRIRGNVKLTMEFDWNGQYGFKFSNIVAKSDSGDFNGAITLVDRSETGGMFIENTWTSNNANIDLTQMIDHPFALIASGSLDADLRGTIKIGNLVFGHLRVDAYDTNPKFIGPVEVKINQIIADDVTISGGIVNSSGAVSMPISLPFDNQPSYCLFSGTPDVWTCNEFIHGDLRGSLNVRDNKFEIFVTSDSKMPDQSELVRKAKLLGTDGVINFQFSDMAGSIKIDSKKSVPTYQFAKNKTLNWMGVNMYFLPDTMLDAPGDFTWNEYGMTFTPYSRRWTIDLNKNEFLLSGKNAKEWFQNIDLRSLNDLEYTISGTYKDKTVSNLEIMIAGHVFRGSVSDKNITLSTELFNIDSFINQDFIDNYGEQQFLTADPLTIPFAIPVNFSLSAMRVIYNGDEFANFVYSLRDNTQSFSVTDSLRGNMLVSISKSGTRYNILLQLNKFVINNQLLNTALPLNIADTMITGQANLSTSGQIAYDIWYNMNGKIDLTFDGGFIVGLGIDNFYANANNTTKMNSELMLANALESGVSEIKSLHIAGDYNSGNFTSTEPFTLSMRHTDATGILNISEGRMTANINLVLRGTSPSPAPIQMELLPNGRRNYSLSQIMINFDPDYFRNFVATHDKF
ncbi:AsmA family protein [Lachnospiraceae bacterium OttesenSCG-928-E19]|nr:AsmA family protein [Lachnospiraceae bacterium OttesenSCG-928-E19]